MVPCHRLGPHGEDRRIWSHEHWQKCEGTNTSDRTECTLALDLTIDEAHSSEVLLGSSDHLHLYICFYRFPNALPLLFPRNYFLIAHSIYKNTWTKKHIFWRFKCKIYLFRLLYSSGTKPTYSIIPFDYCKLFIIEATVESIDVLYNWSCIPRNDIIKKNTIRPKLKLAMCIRSHLNFSGKSNDRQDK